MVVTGDGFKVFIRTTTSIIKWAIIGTIIFVFCITAWPIASMYLIGKEKHAKNAGADPMGNYSVPGVTLLFAGPTVYFVMWLWWTQ